MHLRKHALVALLLAAAAPTSVAQSYLIPDPVDIDPHATISQGLIRSLFVVGTHPYPFFDHASNPVGATYSEGVNRVGATADGQTTTTSLNI